mgnify:CR=1 FL=1
MPVNFLNLAGLNVTDFKESETEYHVRATPVAVSRLCPHCGRSNETVSHAQRKLVIRDIPAHGKAVVIHLDVPRLKCRPCNQTFTATVPEVDTGREMTERLARWVGRQALEYTYADIAKQVGVNEKTVRNIFDEYVASLEKQFKRETPVWLGIDEIKLKRFRAIFTNLQAKSLIDMLPDRYGTSIVAFLASLPNKSRITHVGMDMWRPYRIAVQKVLPNAKIVVDKFHVVSKANVAFDTVRRKIANADKGSSLGLKRAHKLFAKRKNDLNDEQYLTVSGWLNSFPELAAAYDLKEFLVKELTAAGYDMVDHGAHSYDSSDDYPVFVLPCAEAVAADPESRGIVLGGSGNGEQIAANKVKGVRAGLAYNTVMARLAREHNDARIVALGGRMQSLSDALAMVRVFLETPFSNDPRHVRRLQLLDDYENQHCC